MSKKIHLNEIDESFILASVKKDKAPAAENPERLSKPLSAADSEIEEISEEQKNVKSELPENTGDPVETPKEDGRRKRKSQDYESLFIKESPLTARLGKTVYVRREFHDKILRITQVIGENRISLSDYIDNLIAHHFETFQEEISRLYREKNNADLF